MKIRLNKFLAAAGVSSRRHADELIKSKKVFVDGKIAHVGIVIDSEKDLVTIGGEKISNRNNFDYFAFYKPRGIITSLDDIQGEGIAKFLPKNSRLFPVGRLDKDSEGLLILTNDGEFAQELTHPKFEKTKIYHLEFLGKPKTIGKEGIVKKFLSGIKFHNEIYRADKAKFIADNLLEISLHEGKSRQLRIIAGKIGLEVKSLKRIVVGKLNLSNLKLRPGKLIRIKKEDIL